MKWLKELTDWIARQLTALWDAFVEFIGDTLLALVELVLETFARLVEALPVPGFLEVGLGQVFGNLSPAILYYVGVFRIGEGLLVLAGGVAFRLLRKLLTLGQW